MSYPPPPAIYQRPKRRGPYEWALRVILALLIAALGILAGGLVAGWWGPWKATSSTPTTTTTGPFGASAPSTAQDAVTVRKGCLATSLMNNRVSEAQQLDEPSLLDNVATQPGTPWAEVTAMELVGGDVAYRALANDVRAFIGAFTVARANGDVNTLQNAMTAVIASCQTLGEPTS